jgi:hypothetical protein
VFLVKPYENSIASYGKLVAGFSYYEESAAVAAYQLFLAKQIVIYKLLA